VLVLIGVVGFPFLFDTQPRPIAVDIPIEIPSKNSVKPLAMPPKQEAGKEATPPTPTPTPAKVQDKVATASSLGAKEEIVIDKKPVAAGPVVSAPKKSPESLVKPDGKALPKAEQKAEAKPEPKLIAKPDEGARAKALLDGQAAAASASTTERLVVQVGAFADTDKAQEVRLKLEKAGLKTYTQVADTKDGKRIRVRVGPFASKAEAEKAAGKIKSIDLPASILTL